MAISGDVAMVSIKAKWSKISDLALRATSKWQKRSKTNRYHHDRKKCIYRLQNSPSFVFCKKHFEKTQREDFKQWKMWPFLVILQILQ